MAAAGPVGTLNLMFSPKGRPLWVLTPGQDAPYGGRAAIEGKLCHSIFVPIE